MAIIPVVNFVSKLLFQLRKAHRIQSLEDMSTMCGVSNELDIKFLSFPEELKGEVRGVPIKENDPCTTTCFLTSGWIKVIDEPVQCDAAICPTIF